MNNISINRLGLLAVIRKSSKKIAESHPGDAAALANIYDNIKNDKKTFLSISSGDRSRVSYARNTEDKYNLTKRVNTTLAKYIRRQLKLDNSTICDSALEALSNEVSVCLITKSIDSRVKILSGESLALFYRDGPNLSCMSGKINYERIKFYAASPDKVKLLTVDDKFRTLMWFCDDNKTVLLDYFYPRGGLQHDIATKYAQLKGYHMLDTMIYFDKIREDARITLNMTKPCPVIDIFKYGKLSKDLTKVTLRANPWEDDYITFCRYDGTYVQRLF